MVICRDLIRYVDGELGERRDAEFRRHLATCEGCQSKLHSEVRLRERLESLGPTDDTAPAAPDDVAILRHNLAQRRVYALMLLNTILPIVFGSTTWMWIGLAANAVCWCLALAVMSAEIRHLRRSLKSTQEAPSQSTTNQRTA